MSRPVVTLRFAVAALLALVARSGLVAGGAATPTPTGEQDPRSEVFAPAATAASSVSLRALAEAAGVLREGRPEGARVTILKRAHLLVVSVDEVPLETYRIELGRDPDLPKERQGDGRTPEGEYYICEHRDVTRYHRGLLLSYPNAADAARGFAKGLIDAREAFAIRRAIAAGTCPPQDTALGGMILIHGQHPKETAFWESLVLDPGYALPAGLEAGDRDPGRPFAREDWTLGCVGLRNQDIRELFDLLPTGTPVIIRNEE